MGTTPNNILADGYPVGTASYGPVTVDTMCINCGIEASNFQFSQLMIWNQALRLAYFFCSFFFDNSVQRIPTILPGLRSADLSYNYSSITLFSLHFFFVDDQTQ